MTGTGQGRVRLGVIGLGTVAQAVHLPLLAKHPDWTPAWSTRCWSAWPDGGWRSLAVDAVCPGGVRLSLRWHFLDRYPTYREEVRVHHELGSVALTFPSPYLLHAPTVLIVRRLAARHGTALGGEAAAA